MKKLFVFSIIFLLLLQFSCMDTKQDNTVLINNQEGIDFMNAGKYDSALLSFFKALKSHEISKDWKGTVYRNIALSYKELQNIDSAIHFSTLASKCYRKNSYDYLVNLADVDLEKGKTAGALSKLLRAADLYPDEMMVNNTLGLIYLGEYDESLKDLDKALRYNSKAFEVSGSRVTEDVLAKTFYKMENYEKAEFHYEHLLQKYPDMITYSLNMGMVKLKLKHAAEADQLFDKVLLKDSNYKYTIQVFKAANK